MQVNRKVLVSVAALLFLGGCSKVPVVELRAIGGDGVVTDRVSSGNKIQIVGIVTSLPPGAVYYSWVTSAGRCDPQRDKQPITTCRAPTLAEGKTEQTISLDIEADGRVFHDVATLKLAVVNGGAVPPPKGVPPAAGVPPPGPGVEQRPKAGAKDAVKEAKENAKGRENPATATRMSIELTPPYPARGKSGSETNELISGRVSGVASFDDVRVVLYAMDDTGAWFVQPFTVAPFTRISSDSTFATTTHRGQRYAALLVRRSFEPPNVTQRLPDGDRDVLAITQY